VPETKTGHPYFNRESTNFSILNEIFRSAGQRCAAPFQGWRVILQPLRSSVFNFTATRAVSCRPRFIPEVSGEGWSSFSTKSHDFVARVTAPKGRLGLTG
jgi:hypothetical protein